MKKIVYALAFGIGYVLGARAGRERFEQLREAAERFQSDPRVQDVAKRAEAFAEEAVETVRDEQKRSDLVDSVKDTASQVRAQVSGAADDDRVADVKDTAKEAAAEVKDTAKEAAERVRDAADDAKDGDLGDAVDTAKDAAKDLADTAKHQAGEVREKVAAADEGAIEDAVGSAKGAARHVREEAADAVDQVAQETKGSTDGSGTSSALEDPDAHIREVEDEVVHTSGPDLKG